MILKGDIEQAQINVVKKHLTHHGLNVLQSRIPDQKHIVLLIELSNALTIF